MLLMLSVHVMALAQNNANVVRGQVTDEVTGETLISVTVTEVDASNRIINVTVTNYDGEYVLQISNPKNKLRFKYIGFETQDVEIGNKRVINVVMKEQTLTLKDAVVTAKATVSTGTFNIPQREVSMAMQKISAEEFDGIQVASIDDALQGRIAGLDIVNVSGEPGSGMSMRVRGTTSINANTEPLIVINDIPFETEIDDSFDFATANQEQYAQLINVNPDDIESITVLKDAASTAMWGAQGANGVLMITTKKGKAGPTKVNYSYSMTRARQPKGMNMLDGDGYTMLMKQAYYNPKLENASSSIPELNYDTNFTEYENYNNNTDWRKEVSRIGYTHDNNLTISGGGEKVTYRVSVAYYNQTGTVIGQGLNRLSMRSSIDYQVSDRIRFNSDFSYTYSDNDKNHDDILKIAYQKMPNLSVFTQDKNGNDTDIYYHILENSGLQKEQKELSNPVAVANLAMYNIKSYRTSPVFSLSYEFMDRSVTDASLRLNATVSFDINANQTTTFFPKEAANLAWNDDKVNQAKRSESESMGLYSTANLMWRPVFKNENHSLNLNAKFSLSSNTSNSIGMGATGMPSSWLTAASSTAKITEMSTSSSENRKMSFAWSFHYAYAGKYIVGCTVNRAGSSKFGDNFRYGFFPAISTKWILSDEAFFEPIRPIISQLSPRFSIGITGNEPAEAFIHLSRYGEAGQFIDIPAVKPLNMRLANLRWEKTTQTNYGIDVELLEGKFSTDFNYYYKHTTDLLFKDLGISSTSGYPTLKNRNVGVMDNYGWEFNFNARDVVRTEQFRMDVNFNFSNNRNVIVDLTDDVLAQYNKEFDYKNGSYLTRIQENNPVGSIYGFKYKGVYQYNDYDPSRPDATCPIVRDANGNPIFDAQGNTKPMYFAYGTSSAYEFKGGDAIYEDINHDGSIDELDIVYLGNSLPKINGGFGFTFRFGKGFSINTFFNYRVGNKVVNKARMEAENMYTNSNQSVAVNWRWRKEGDITEMPRALYNYGYNWLGSDRYVEDASFLRFKYLTVNYSLPKELLKPVGLNQASLYLSFQNIACLTKYTGVDPEVGYGGMSVATDGAKTPRSKDILLRLRLGF